MQRLTKLLKTPLVVGVVIAGLLGTGLVAAGVRRASQEDEQRWLSDRAEVVRERIESTVLDLTLSVEAIAAFLEVSPEMGQERFSEFVSRLDERLGFVGIAYLELVEEADLATYEQRTRARIPGFQVYEITAEGGSTARLGERARYYPVELFTPGTLLTRDPAVEVGPLGIGADGGSIPEFRESIERALRSGRPAVSDFIEPPIDQAGLGEIFMIAVPVRDRVGDRPFRGVIAAPILDALLLTDLDMSVADEIAWELHHPTTHEETDAPVWEDDLEIAGSIWHLRVSPIGDAQADGSPMGWGQVAAVGVAATILIAGVAELLRQRARSRLKVEELERLSDEKDRFLAAVSHEIRTPLTAVSGLARELRDRPSEFSPEELHSLLATVSEQSDEVAAIVEDLLVAARSDMGKVTVSHTAVDVREQVRLALEGAGIETAIVGRPQTLAFADPQRVRQILRNLLTNAVRYGGEELEVRFDTRQDTISVMVADTGPPIPEDQQVRIFDPYTSAHGDDAVVGSIGLGLFISRTLAELMDGALTYHHDGMWSIFTLCLPSAEAAHAAKVAAAGLAR